MPAHTSTGTKFSCAKHAEDSGIPETEIETLVRLDVFIVTLQEKMIEMDNLKICHAITRMIVGGAQENTLLSAIGQMERGHEVVLLTGPSPGPEGELLKKMKVADMEVVENPFLVREINPIKDLRAYFSMKKFFRERGFDVVHTHSSKAGVFGRGAAWAAGVPFVCHTVHGQAFHPYESAWRNFLYKAAERWAAKRCHRIFAVARAMVEQCVSANIAARDKYKVVYSGMELEPFLEEGAGDALRKELGIPADSPVVGTIARFFPLKGYEYFVPAAGIIAEHRPDTHFLLVGDGILKDRVAAECRGLGLNAHFAGLVPPGEVHRFTAAMDVLVHLSLREGLPRAVVQALASGKPAVGFSLDGTPEVIIDGRTGFIVTPEDSDSVAESVLKILDDRKMAAAMGLSGRELVKSRFDWRKMAEILLKEYFDGLERR